MQIGDPVRVYPVGRPEQAGEAVVIAVAKSGDSIAVTLLPVEMHIYAHREHPQAPWIDLETGQALEIN